MSDGPSVEEKLHVCIVTPTRDREELVRRLYQSLLGQSDRDFNWVVIDDGGSDQTAEWLHRESMSSPFRVDVIRNPFNSGKAASLNRAFDCFSADLYLVVDSDDRLLPSAIALVRAKARKYYSEAHIGAIFFSYVDSNGSILGGPPAGRETAMFRSKLDATHGKYDGCVGYYARAVGKYRYPQFPGETYVGPTVLQLLMEPEYQILFADDVIGVAEYQPGGLTDAGRSLRLRNPLGMMAYSKLCAERGTTWLARFKYRISYWAYCHVVLENKFTQSASLLAPPTGLPGERWLGRVLALRWLKATGIS